MKNVNVTYQWKLKAEKFSVENKYGLAHWFCFVEFQDQILKLHCLL